MTKRPKEEEKIKMNIATTVHFPHSYMQGLKKGSGWYNSHRSWILGPKKDWKLTQRMATVASHGKTFNEWRLPAHTESIHSIRPWANKCHITLSFFHATFVFSVLFFVFSVVNFLAHYSWMLCRWIYHSKELLTQPIQNEMIWNKDKKVTE